jgi:hypothetical protein
MHVLYKKKMTATFASWTVDITAEDEVRLTTQDGMVTQKKFANDTSNQQEVYDNYWTREIASFLSENEFLQSRWPQEMQHLQWTLYHYANGPSHKDLVKSLRRVLRKWIKACLEDDNCMPQPSKAMMQDREFQKIFNYLKQKSQSAITESV